MHRVIVPSSRMWQTPKIEYWYVSKSYSFSMLSMIYLALWFGFGNAVYQIMFSNEPLRLSQSSWIYTQIKQHTADAHRGWIQIYYTFSHFLFKSLWKTFVTFHYLMIWHCAIFLDISIRKTEDCGCKINTIYDKRWKNLSGMNTLLWNLFSFEYFCFPLSWFLKFTYCAISYLHWETLNFFSIYVRGLC